MVFDPTTQYFYPAHTTPPPPALTLSIFNSTLITPVLPSTPATNFAVPVNNFSSMVGPSGYTAGSALLTLISGCGATLPVLVPNQFFRVTVIKQGYAYIPGASPNNYTI